MNVRRMGLRASQRKTLEILEELRELALTGDLVGMAYVAEVRGDPMPKFGVLGRYNGEPYHGLSACSRLSSKLTRIADWREQFQTPM